MTAVGSRSWTSRHRGTSACLVAAAGLAVVFGSAGAAAAHPLGNATVNHYDGLRLYPDHIADTAVEDVAEIPTLQRKPLIDSDGDGLLAPAERDVYARRQCAALVAAVRVTVDRRRVPLRVTSADYSERPGAINLPAGRLVCELDGRADLSRPGTVGIEDQWDGAGIGWHELTAVGVGVALHDSPIPARSISDALQHYPNDLLSSPLDQRRATVAATPGSAASTYARSGNAPSAGAVSRLLNRVTTEFNGLVGARHLTLGVGLLAVLLAILLGAGHAFLPGHGKTIMAAYLVGRRGRVRDVAAVGATVTVTHTAGVLVVGLLLSVSVSLAPTVIEQGLAVVSGVVVALVGLGLLVSAVRRRRSVLHVAAAAERSATVLTESAPAPALAYAVSTADGHAGHPHGHDHHEVGHHHEKGHHHHHPHEGHEHHDHGTEAASGFGRKGLVGLGIAGGLVPSPSALLVLLAAVALGRTVLGVVLVLAYGLGMALALTSAGLLLVHVRGRLGRLTSTAGLRWIDRVAHTLPVVTALLVVAVGAGLVLRALAGTV